MRRLSRVTVKALILGGALAAGSLSAFAVLEKGRDGPAVTVIQKKLKPKYYKGPVDGDFGSATQKAVKAFQKAKGLKADGVVGDTTFRRIMGTAAKPKLEQGSKRTKSVKKLQRLLNLKQDGKFGSGTKKAVAKFQRSKGIRDNGVVESDTFYMLKW